MLDILCKSFIENSGRIALHIDDKSYSYSDIWNYSQNIYTFLSDLNLEENSIIAVITGNNAETYGAILGIWRAGYAYLPLNPDYPAARLKQIVENSKPSVIINTSGTHNTSEFSENVMTVSEVMCKKGLDNQSLFFPRNANSLMYVLFTSGSTGNPKGVPITYENLSAFYSNISKEEYNFKEEDVWLQMFDFTFDVSVASFLLPWIYGASIVSLVQKKNKFLEIIKAISKRNVAVAFMVPSVVSLMGEHLEGECFSSLRYTFFTGEPLKKHTAEIWKKAAPESFIENYYGPTEGTIEYFHYKIPDKNILEHHGIVCIGKPLFSEKYSIIDEKNKPVSTGKKGELCLSGLQVTKGYLNDSVLNMERFITDEEGSVYYRTGDLCFVDSSGNVYYCSRLDEQIQIQGFRVEPGEIEQAAMTYSEDIKPVAIAIQNKEIQFFILFYTGRKLDKNRLLQHIASRLPAYMMPSEIHYLPNFPYTESGKVNKKKLKDLYKNNSDFNDVE